MGKLVVILAACIGIVGCTYGPNAATYQSNYYPPVGYVLQAQPASNIVCGPGTTPVYQTFWTYDSVGRFNPTQQYVCAPSSGGKSSVNPQAGYPTQPVAPILR